MRCAACRLIIDAPTVALLVMRPEAGALRVSVELVPIERARPGQPVAHVEHTSEAVDEIGRRWSRRHD